MKNIKIFIVAISLALMASTCPHDNLMKIAVLNQSDEPITVITNDIPWRESFDGDFFEHLNKYDNVEFRLKPGERHYQIAEYGTNLSAYDNDIIFSIIIFRQSEFDGQSLSELIESGRWAMRKQYTYDELKALKFRIVYP